MIQWLGKEARKQGWIGYREDKKRERGRGIQTHTMKKPISGSI